MPLARADGKDTERLIPAKLALRVCAPQCRDNWAEDSERFTD